MRYFLSLSYLGHQYAGWQVQPNADSVQHQVQAVLSLLLRQPISVTGCGRTDAGVHAAGYIAHLDWEGGWPDHLVGRMNKLLPSDIVIHDIFPVPEDAHARFSALERRYVYRLGHKKNPFRARTTWHYHLADRLSLTALNEAAGLLLSYREFAPFCKTGTDAKTRVCDLKESFWIYDEGHQEFAYWVTSDRFLRGMIRLIVGMCIRVAEGKTNLADVRQALESQQPLNGSWSVPPQGLMLTGIRYPRFPEVSSKV